MSRTDLPGWWSAGDRRLAPDPLRAALFVALAWAAGIAALSAAALVAQARLAGWPGLASPAGVAPAAALAAVSFLLRLLRWHLLATRVAPGLRLGSSFLVGTIGFGLIMTPARAGEALKLLLLRQRAAVPVATSAPVYLVEKASEAAALASLALVASLFLPWTEGIQPSEKLAAGFGLLLALVLAVAFWRPLAAVVPRLPLASRMLRRPGLAELWEHLLLGGEQVLSWRVLGGSLSLSLLARLADGLAIYWLAEQFGVQLTLAAAWFLIGSTGFLGGVSMLPGGVGLVEASLAGLLLAFGASPAAATALALMARLLIFWVWVALGLLLALRYAVSWSNQEQGVAPP